ncbi:hypothetical protein QLX08_011330 [Tetragonisca angustula]|uniref:Uncharacterized protein n=1 Tax=Tetragonisca angustula TaxID=166442 RepID=A0AAW0Z932_9HYME
MMRIIETISIRLPVFVLLIATLVLRSGAYEGNDGNGGSLAYSSAYAAADVWQPFPGSGSLAGSHDGHKGIRSYDNAGSNRPNDEGNRRGAGCTKCKWEDDDYWEKGWEDEAGDEEDSDDCYDDGQYREHDHGHGRGGSPPAVQKLGAPSPSGASAVGSGGPPFRATPVKQGGPWDAKSPVFGQQPGPGWTTVAPGTSSRPTWNQGFDGGAAQPSGNSPNVGARPADVGGSKTGSECSGGYQRGTGCAQGAGGVGPVKQLPFVGFNPGNVQKQASSDYAGGSTAVYNPRGCSNSPYDTGCADKSVDGTRPGDSSVVPSYGPTVGQGQHSGSGSPQSSPFGSPYDSSASQGQHPGSGSPQSSPFGPSGQGQHPGSGSPQSSPFGPLNQGQHPGSGSPQSSSFGPLNQGQHPGSGSPQSSPFGPLNQGQHPGSGSPQSSPFGPSGQGQHPGSGSPQSSPFGPLNQGQHPGSGSPQSSPFGPSGQGQHPGSGSPQSSPFGPSGQGQHPGSGSPKENSDYGTGPYRGFPGSTKSTVKPGNPPNFNAVANAVSSSVAYASTGPGVGHPASGPSTSTYSSGTLPGSPGSSGGSVPYGSRKPSRTNVKESLSGTAPKHDASKDGESKIFYIDVKPVPGSPLGVRPRTTTSAPYSVVKTTPVQQSTFYSPPGSTKPSYQPTPYSGPGATKPSYQTTPYGGPTTTKPSYQPAPYDGPGITKPSYQPSAYGGPGTTKPFYQPPPYDGPGITKPSYQPAPYDSSGTTKLFHQPTPYGGPGTTKISYQPTPYGDLGTTKPSYQPAPYNGPRTTKPFYQPASYDGPGVTKPSFQLTPYSGPSTVKPSYQPAPYGGPTTTKPFYQPVPHNGPGIKKPSYQPAPYSGPGTTEPSYQPAPYGGPSTVKPSYQPALYDGPGLTKPSYQPAPYSGTETTKSPYQFPSKDTNVGCTRGAEDCEAASGCSGGTNLNGSPDYKPCGQPGLPVAINKTSGPVGGFQAYPTDFAQNPQQNIPGASQPFDGFPVGVGSGSRDCTSGSSDCTSGSVRPAYVDNKIPGEGGSYSSNPFLNGKIPNLIGMTHGGQFAATTTSKPIGFGNPFLQPGNAGAFAGAAAWSNVGSATASNPAGKSVVSIGGETTKPVSRDNPFLGESGHGRGDIEIDNPPGGSASWSPGNDLTNTGLGQTNVNPFLGDKTQQGSVRPSDRYPGSSWSSGPIDDASSSATKSPSAAPRGSGSGGGVGIGLGGFASDKLGHDGGGSFPGAFSGAFSSSQSSSNSGAGATNPIFGQANDGSWASGGVNAASQAGSGAWSSSGASAYAASSASSWAGSQPSFVKG